MKKKKNPNSLHTGVKRSDIEFAKKLRKNQTSAEKLLWEYLKGRKLQNAKFRRQHPIGGFIVDFYCHNSQLVIELDGSIHHQIGQKEYDKERQEVLEEVLKLRVLRFQTTEVSQDIDSVLRRIEEFL